MGAFSQFRSKLSKKTEDEIETLKGDPKVWNVHSVLNVLHSLVDKSNINKQLEVYNNQGNPDSVAGDFGRHSLYKMLGYFSLVGLLRLHSLLGDFYQAIKVLENIELKLYTTMPLDKMAGFMEMPPEEFRNHLLAFKHKMKNVVWTKGTSGLEGEFQSGSEVDFYIDKNMIHIADTKVARRYGDFFIRQIHKFDELNRGLRKIQL